MLGRRRTSSTAALVLLLVLTLLVAAACGSQPPADGTDDQQGSDVPQDEEQGNVEWRVLSQDDLDEEVAAWIDEHKEDVGIFQEIFGDETVIMIAWGEKDSAGYDVDVEALTEVEEGRLQIYVNLTEPGEDEDTAQAITHPYAVIAVTPALYYELEPLFAGALFLQNKAFRIEEPSMFAVIDDTLRVKGTARVFEAQFQVYLEDGHIIMVDMPVMADAGAPEWGDFEVEVPLETVPTSPSGILMIYESSAKDGSPVNVLTIPVRFANWE